MKARVVRRSGSARGTPATPRTMQPVPYHKRPADIGRLLWRQAENVRSIKNAFHDAIQDEPDGRTRRREKATLRRMLALVRDALAVAEREIDLYEPRYYDPGSATWRPLTAEAKRAREELATAQAAVWAGARRRRMEERRQHEQQAGQEAIPEVHQEGDT